MGALAATTALASGVRTLGQAPAENQPKPVTIAFVGCAHIHTPGFIGLIMKERRDVRVKYVWDHLPARAEKRAAELGAKVTDSLEQIWSDPEVTAVVICSETNRHHELVLAAAKAGKHLFAEKPLGITARESAEMADAIEQAGVLFTTGYFMRTMPVHLFLREQVRAGAFGKITRVRGSNCHSGSLGGWFDAKPDKPWEDWRWMADPKIAGVGAFGDLGTHMLDILLWMLGDVESVTADIRVVNGRYGDCDEAGEALLRFKNGAVGTLAAGWVDVADPVTLQIAGTEAHAVVVNGSLFFTCAKIPGADGKQPWTAFPKGPVAPMHQFINAVAGQAGMPLVSAREAAARVAVMEAAYLSTRSGTRLKPVQG
jgi:predicted dehydrogenase